MEGRSQQENTGSMAGATLVTAPASLPANGAPPALPVGEMASRTLPDASDRGDAPASRTPRPWLRSVSLAGLLVALIVGALVGIRYWRFAATHVSTDDAYLTTHVAPITPQVDGHIRRVLVDDNQRVKAGQLLAILDDATFRAGVDQAEADLAAARASERGSASTVRLTAQTGRAAIAQASGGVAQAASARSAAQSDAQRAQAALAGAQAGEQSAHANARTAQAALESSLSGKRRALDAVQGAEARVKTAQAGVEAARAAITAAAADAEKTAKDAARYADLYQQGAVSAQTSDTARAAAIAAGARLDSARQQLAQAQATVAQLQADLAVAQEQVTAADSAIEGARAQLAAAQAAVLAAQAGVRQSQAQALSAQQGIRQAQARRAQAAGALQQAQTVPTQLSVSRANDQMARAKTRQAEAALESARIALRRTRITAPVSGIISQRTAQVGQQVAVGQPIMAIVPDNELWVAANFQETQTGKVRPGQRAEVTVDALPGRRFTGRVNSIAAGTGASFALLPPDNATGNFTKVVQRVPVKIVLDPNQKDLGRLRSGLSVVAAIDTSPAP